MFSQDTKVELGLKYFFGAAFQEVEDAGLRSPRLNDLAQHYAALKLSAVLLAQGYNIFDIKLPVLDLLLNEEVDEGAELETSCGCDGWGENKELVMIVLDVLGHAEEVADRCLHTSFAGYLMIARIIADMLATSGLSRSDPNTA